MKQRALRRIWVGFVVVVVAGCGYVGWRFVSLGDRVERTYQGICVANLVVDYRRDAGRWPVSWGQVREAYGRREERHEMLGFAFEQLQKNIEVRWDVLMKANAENGEPVGDVLALKNGETFFDSPPNPNEVIRRRGKIRVDEKSRALQGG